MLWEQLTVYLDTEPCDTSECPGRYEVSYQVWGNRADSTWGDEVRWTTWAKKWGWAEWKMTSGEALFMQTSVTGWCSIRAMVFSYPTSQYEGMMAKLDDPDNMPPINPCEQMRDMEGAETKRKAAIKNALRLFVASKWFTSRRYLRSLFKRF